MIDSGPLIVSPVLATASTFEKKSTPSPTISRSTPGPTGIDRPPVFIWQISWNPPLVRLRTKAIPRKTGKVIVASAPSAPLIS
jgi:hypothetical protein